MLTGRDIMSSNNTTAEEFRLADRLGTIINLDDLTLVDLLEQSIRTSRRRLLPLQSWLTLGQAREGFQVMDEPRGSQIRHDPCRSSKPFPAWPPRASSRFGLHDTLSNEYYPALGPELSSSWRWN